MAWLSASRAESNGRRSTCSKPAARSTAPSVSSSYAYLVLAPLPEEIVDAVQGRVAPRRTPPLLERKRSLVAVDVMPDDALGVRDNHIEQSPGYEDAPALTQERKHFARSLRRLHVPAHRIVLVRIVEVLDEVLRVDLLHRVVAKGQRFAKIQPQVSSIRYVDVDPSGRLLRAKSGSKVQTNRSAGVDELGGAFYRPAMDPLYVDLALRRSKRAA